MHLPFCGCVGTAALGSDHVGTAALGCPGRAQLAYFAGKTSTSTPEASPADRYTRSVAFWKSPALALGISTKVCGLRSTSGNQELCTWIMMRCPRRKV